MGQKSYKLTEDEKMKMRYLREQKEMMHKQAAKVSKKRSKFNLEDSDGEDEQVLGFTHGGRRLEVEDDFKEHISDSSDEGEPGQKGYLDDEIVQRMNFGGGDEEEAEGKKSRKEVFDEIISKSKAFKIVRSEARQVNEELRH